MKGEHSMTTARLRALAEFHPSLSWDQIGVATAVVWGDLADWRPITIDVCDVNGHAETDLTLAPLLHEWNVEALNQTRRTFDSARLVELAAIGIGALTLQYAGAHEIIDVTARGSGADYLVGAERHLLEIAGRSRKIDFQKAWNDRWERLVRRGGAFLLFVVEFETPRGRMQFCESGK